MNVGQRVSHPIYGAGTIIAVQEKKLGDGKNGWPEAKQSSILPTSNGASNYLHLFPESINISIKFDNGGPIGFATNATNNVKDLTLL
jgi:hypothetical protein